MDNNTPTVFLSYSHDTLLHKQRVLSLANRLRDNGIDCTIDQYESFPAQGWPRWMQDQIRTVDFVLVIATESYTRRVLGNETPGIGLGATWEGAIITQEMYESGGRNTKFIPVVFEQNDVVHIPPFLKPFTYYDVAHEYGYNSLYRHLTKQPAIVKPPLGSIREFLPEVQSASHANTVGKQDFSDLVLVLDLEGSEDVIILKSRSVEIGEFDPWHQTNITAQLEMLDEGTYANVSQMSQRGREIGIAFGLRAYHCSILRSTLRRDRNKNVWNLECGTKATNGRLFEINFEGFTADDVAEMRARRILLNESKSEASSGQGVYSMLEESIQGRTGPFRVLGSPFPALHALLEQNQELFLAASKLLGVLWLTLSNTVEHVLTLDLSMRGRHELLVEFRGQRQQIYTNRKPVEIKIKGSCVLK